jgi:hypothetical protein
MEAGEKMNGTEHDAALGNVRYHPNQERRNTLGFQTTAECQIGEELTPQTK